MNRHRSYEMYNNNLKLLNESFSWTEFSFPQNHIRRHNIEHMRNVVKCSLSFGGGKTKQVNRKFCFWIFIMLLLLFAFYLVFSAWWWSKWRILNPKLSLKLREKKKYLYSTAHDDVLCFFFFLIKHYSAVLHSKV